MRLNALLMCRDQHSLRVLAAALEELDIEQEICLSAPEAMELLMQGHYSLVVIDFDLPAAAQVARIARMAPPQRRPVVFAMIGALTGVAPTFEAGANFVMYKPLALPQVTRSLRAGRGFMQPDRRRSPRQALETLVYLQFGVAALPAIVLDLNERGLALQAAEPLPAVPEVPFRFVLPGTSAMVEGVGEMIWADEEGRVGMLFSHMTAPSRRSLKDWLSKRSRKGRAAHLAARPQKSRMSLLVSH
ncbi:MAG TPA: PilZ domain-containing protein [Terriglobales bacterium]|jgi:ActR/RegA family two-component response regulator|nr:PilZ domain-containing protein [Terriglobales bacterium]